jgi:hypothetical protein
MKQRLTNEGKQDAETRSEHREEQGLEFQSAEEAIRFDAAQVVVPPQLRERVLREVVVEERARLSWWKRWFR